MKRYLIAIIYSDTIQDIVKEAMEVQDDNPDDADDSHDNRKFPLEVCHTPPPPGGGGTLY